MEEGYSRVNPVADNITIPGFASTMLMSIDQILRQLLRNQIVSSPVHTCAQRTPTLRHGMRQSALRSISRRRQMAQSISLPSSLILIPMFSTWTNQQISRFPLKWIYRISSMVLYPSPPICKPFRRSHISPKPQQSFLSNNKPNPRLSTC